MRIQTKITILFILISVEMGHINADFSADRAILGNCFKPLLEDAKSWFRWKLIVNPAETYQTFLQGWLTIDLKGFEKQTKEVFETVIFDDYVHGSSIKWDVNSKNKAAAIVKVCKDIENTGLENYYAPNIPLVDYLEELYNKTGQDTAEFQKYCQTKAADRS